MVYQIIIFAILVLSLVSFGHWLVYKTLVDFFLITKLRSLIILKSVIAFLGLSFFVSFLIVFRFENILTRLYYILSMVWLGSLWYLFIACCVLWIVAGIARYFDHPLASPIWAGIIFGLALLVVAYGIINASRIRVSEVAVELPGLPDSWQGRTAVWISDSHFGQIWGYGTAEKTAAKITAQNPDIVFIGGDLFDGVKVDVKKIAEIFGKIQPPLGTYFITGNHEEFGSEKLYVDAVSPAGITVLKNSKITIGGVQILGVDYREAGNVKVFETILKNMKIDKSQPAILLKHVPDYFGKFFGGAQGQESNYLKIAQDAGVSLQLSGHTHRGQMYPFGYLTSWVYHGYDYGLKKFNAMWEYTSTGSGTWGPPMRIGADPEIVLIRFVKS